MPINADNTFLFMTDKLNYFINKFLVWEIMKDYFKKFFITFQQTRTLSSGKKIWKVMGMFFSKLITTKL